jgi:hypothetical protein
MTATLAMFADDPDAARSFEDAGGAAVATWSGPGRLAGTATLPFGEVPADDITRRVRFRGRPG